jgi:hypothetical protein
MKAAFKTLLALALVLTVGFVALAEEKKEEKGKAVTLKGTITCAKCDLKETKACATVIKTKDGVFFFDAKSGKKNHKAICTEPKEGSVTGVVSEKDGKKTITVSKVEFKE